MKRLLLVINPKAGKGKIATYLLDIIRLFNDAGYEVIVYPTRKPKDAVDITAKYVDRTDMIVCSGGDGTLDEVVTGIMRTGKDIPVGYIPAGSTNDFANSLFMPKNPLDVVRNMLKGNIYRCDIGRFNDRTFTYVAAFGLFTDVSYQTSQDMKNLLGHVAYLLEGFTRLFDIRAYHMRIVAEDANIEIETDFIYGMVTNSRSVGGMKNLTKDVDMNDGMFEVMLIEKPKNPLELQMITGALMLGDDKNPQIHSFKTRQISFHSDQNIDWTLDGEFGGSFTEVVVENYQEALSLYLTSTKGEKSS